MKLFFDTMIFLHFRSLDELPFDELFGSGSHEVIIPRIISSELSKHKDTHSNTAIRGRARKALKQIETWSTKGKIKDNVSLRFIHTTPLEVCKTNQLDPNSGDDLLIAAVLDYMSNFKDQFDIRIVSEDTGVRITSKQLGITAEKLPEEYKLQVDLDPLQVENKKLKRQLEKLRHAMPRLSVSFATEVNRTTHCPVSVSGMSKSEESKLFEKLKSEQPTLDESLFNRVNDPHYLNVAGDKDRFLREYSNFPNLYESYIKKVINARKLARRLCRFQIQIENDGTAPAEDVDVHLHFPDGFKLYDLSNAPRMPNAPSVPAPPRSIADMLNQNIGYPFKTTQQHYNPKLEVSSFEIRRTNSYDVTDHFKRIKHGDIALLPEMVLIFDSVETAQSFQCEYTLRPANCPEAIVGELHFVVEK